MKRTTRHALIGSGAVLALTLMPMGAMAEPAAGESGEASQDSVVTLDLYNLTDVHGHIEQVSKSGTVKEAGLPAMNCYLKKARETNPNSSFTLLGDNIGASPFTSGSLKDNPTIAALNTLNPVASTIGNHELDLGQAVFKQRVDGSNLGEYVQVGFPYLGANVEGMGTWDKGGVQTPYLGDYEVWASPSGVKVAFIGAIAQDVPYKLSPEATRGLTFNDPIARIDELAKTIKDSGEAQIVIAMLDDDVKNNYPLVGQYVDGLMGGDTHVTYEFDKIDSAERLDSKNPLLAGVASGSYTDNLGLIRISYDTAAKKVLSADTQLVPAATVAECGTDPETQAVVDKAKEESKAAGQRVIATGQTASFLRGVFTAPDGSTSPGSNRGIESSAGDLVADAMREVIRTERGDPVDIGMINAGGIRTDLVPNEDGTITYGQVFEMLPFSNELYYVPLLGADVKLALEQQWKTDLSTQNSRPMLKLGLSNNVRYTYDPARPYGERITSVMINGEPLDPARTYTVGLAEFLKDGGDSFPALTNGGPGKTNGFLDRDEVVRYLADHPGLAPRAAKASVGVTLPDGVLEDGATATIALRGLSFSEGPSVTKTVKVGLGGDPVEAEVDNSLVEAHASDAASIITTDGAGQASVNVKVSANAQCEGKSAGEIVRVPVTVDTDFARVVTADQGLGVDVKCTGAQAPVPPTPQSGDQNQSAGQTTPKGGADVAKGSPLAKTGATVGVVGLLAVVLLGAGALLVTRKHA